MQVSPKRTAVAAWIGDDEARHWELVPLLALPELDLSVSVKSRLIHNRRVDRLFHAVARSPLTLVAYITAMGLTTAVFYIPDHIGHTLGIAALVLGVPGAFVSICNLRYDMVAVMARTLDAWFAVVVATICSVSLSFLFHDTRAVLVAPFWLGFLTNACVDASVLGLRAIRIANVLTVLTCIAMATAVSIDVADDLTTSPLVRVNGSVLSAITVVRECLLTMIIVVIRNVFRKHMNALDAKQHTTKLTVFRCVSFRCRLRLRAAADPTQRLPNERPSRPSWQTVTEHSSAQTKAKLRFIPSLPVIDTHHSIVPMGWLWRYPAEHFIRLRRLLQWIGLVGVVLANGLIFVSVTARGVLDQRRDLPIAIIGVSATTLFVGTTTAAAQRELVWAIVTSFDFLYITFKITIAHITVISLFPWEPTVVLALVATWQWWLWILWCDALPPPVRTHLGLSHRLVSGIALALVGVTALVVVTLSLIDSPNVVGDAVLLRIRVGREEVEFRAFSWFLSSVATVAPWVLRIVWRLWLAADTELVVLDGTVVYENEKPAKLRGQEIPHTRRIAPVIPLDCPATPMEEDAAVSGRDDLAGTS